MHSQAPLEPSTTPDRFDAYLDGVRRAAAGDESALDLMQEAFAELPALASWVGDLAASARERLIHAVAGDNPALRTALEAKVWALGEELSSPHASPLERLLVDRVLACWVALHHIEQEYALRLEVADLAAADWWERRLERAQHRYFASVTKLAQVRRLLGPSVVVNVAQQQVNVVR